MKKLIALILAVLMVAGLAACAASKPAAAEDTAAANTEEPKAEETADAPAAEDAETESKDTFVIGYAQRGSDVAFTIAMMEDNIAYAKEHYPNIEFLQTDAHDDAATQASNIEDLIAAGVDLIMVSPLTEDGLTDACQAAMDAGIPVVTMDRTVLCDVTCKVVADNYLMGQMAADKLAEMLGGKGNVIECCGTYGASATYGRQYGFEERMAEKYPDIKIIDSKDCNYNSAEAATYMEDMLQKYGTGEIQAIYAHNDVMAYGAIETLKAAGRDNEGILVCGMDGEEAAFQMVKDGIMAFDIIYPTMAPEGVIAAYGILTGEAVDKEVWCEPTLVSAENVDEYLGTGLQ